MIKLQMSPHLAVPVFVLPVRVHPTNDSLEQCCDPNLYCLMVDSVRLKLSLLERGAAMPCELGMWAFGITSSLYLHQQ